MLAFNIVEALMGGWASLVFLKMSERAEDNTIQFDISENDRSALGLDCQNKQLHCP